MDANEEKRIAIATRGAIAIQKGCKSAGIKNDTTIAQNFQALKHILDVYEQERTPE